MEIDEESDQELDLDVDSPFIPEKRDEYYGTMLAIFGDSSMANRIRQSLDLVSQDKITRINIRTFCAASFCLIRNNGVLDAKIAPILDEACDLIGASNAPIERLETKRDILRYSAYLIKLSRG